MAALLLLLCTGDKVVHQLCLFPAGLLVTLLYARSTFSASSSSSCWPELFPFLLRSVVLVETNCGDFFVFPAMHVQVQPTLLPYKYNNASREKPGMTSPRSAAATSSSATDHHRNKPLPGSSPHPTNRCDFLYGTPLHAALTAWCRECASL